VSNCSTFTIFAKFKQTVGSDALKDVKFIESHRYFFAKMAACNTNINYNWELHP